ncbi:N-6 DNA methylase [Flammeovirgaceae bacterium 311]|nr:N-6 DNA methylase [Flammeovirgaceae bacterium 311]
MTIKKSTGSFYTPSNVAAFLVERLVDKLSKKKTISVLEPSAGDGIFVDSVYKNHKIGKKISRLVAVEINNLELEKIREKVVVDSFEGVNSDFLEYQNANFETFDLVIGNPPYIKKTLLQEAQIEECRKIHSNAGLSKNSPKNIWTAFLVRCIKYTSEDGVLAFVLPSELLQVKYAEELRKLVTQEFERVEVFTFSKLLFHDCKGQDTILLIGERKSNEPGTYYKNIDQLGSKTLNDSPVRTTINIKDSKWSHYHLTNDEAALLENIKSSLKPIRSHLINRDLN